MRFRQILLIAIAVSTVTLAVWYVSTVQIRSIKRTIRFIQEAIRNEDTAGCIGRLSNHYLDAYGYRPDDVARILNSAFGSMEDISVIILEMDIERSGDSATVKVSFRVVATVEMGLRGYVIGNMKQPASVEIRMKRTGDVWLVEGIEQIQNPY